MADALALGASIRKDVWVQLPLAAQFDILMVHMQTNVLKYNVYIRKEGKHFVAYVPTLSISDFGTTVDLAQHHVRDAIACHVEGLIKTGNEVPHPDTAEFYLSQAEITVPKFLKFAF